VKTGTNAAESAALANRLRDQVWDLEGDREGDVCRPEVPKKGARRRSRAISPAIREKPVAIEKIAVLRAT
jgi:hypothetical protein